MIAQQNAQVVTIDGCDFEFGVGSTIRPDGWVWPMTLLECEWDAADYRIESAKYAGRTMCVNVKISGRKIDYRDMTIRCQIEFVQDGEESVIHHGWVKLK